MTQTWNEIMQILESGRRLPRSKTLRNEGGAWVGAPVPPRRESAAVLCRFREGDASFDLAELQHRHRFNFNLQSRNSQSGHSDSRGGGIGLGQIFLPHLAIHRQVAR